MRRTGPKSKEHRKSFEMCGGWRTIGPAMPSTVTITDLLRTEDIHVHFSAPSVIDAIPQLLGPALERSVKSAAARDEIIAAVVKRERETATACGTLSLPHARAASVDDFVVSVAANAGGVIAGHPTPEIVFAFVTPEKKREEHLHFLASLARLSQNRDLVHRIAAATDPNDVIAALRTAGM